MDQMVAITRGLVGKRLRYQDLIGPAPQREAHYDVF